MQPLSSDVLMALALTSTGNAMGMLTVLTRVTKRAVVKIINLYSQTSFGHFHFHWIFLLLSWQAILFSLIIGL